MPTNSKPVLALIWDMGGVLVRNMDPAVRGRLAAPFGMSYMDLENLYFGNDKSTLASIGQAHEADAWEVVRKKLNLTTEEMPEFIQTFWSCDQLDEELFAFTMSLKPRYRVGLLSNATPETRTRLAASMPHFYDMFDISIFSAEVGMAKPTPQIYRVVLDQLGVEPEEAVFVDDFIENVIAARDLGIHSIHFKNSQQAREALKEFFL